MPQSPGFRDPDPQQQCLGPGDGAHDTDAAERLRVDAPSGEASVSVEPNGRHAVLPVDLVVRENRPVEHQPAVAGPFGHPDPHLHGRLLGRQAVRYRRWRRRRPRLGRSARAGSSAGPAEIERDDGRRLERGDLDPRSQGERQDPAVRAERRLGQISRQPTQRCRDRVGDRRPEPKRHRSARSGLLDRRCSTAMGVPIQGEPAKWPMIPGPDIRSLCRGRGEEHDKHGQGGPDDPGGQTSTGQVRAWRHRSRGKTVKADSVASIPPAGHGPAHPVARTRSTRRSATARRPLGAMLRRTRIILCFKWLTQNMERGSIPRSERNSSPRFRHRMRYFKELEHLICVRLDAGCVSRTRLEAGRSRLG